MFCLPRLPRRFEMKYGFRQYVLREQFLSTEISSVTCDSRFVQPGSIFVAIQGTESDGARYISEAHRAGAAAFVGEASVAGEFPQGVPVLLVENARRMFAILSAVFSGQPSRDLLSIAVTGTNGKTSICWILTEMLRRLSGDAAQIGTLGQRILSDDFLPLETTTPDAGTLQGFFQDVKAAGVRSVCCEASSHGLSQDRTFGTQWDRAIFSNLTRDHLDYHSSFAEYGAAKKRLFVDELASSSKESRRAILNFDDDLGRAIANELSLPSISYSVAGAADADFRMVSNQRSLAGARFEVESHGSKTEFVTTLVGDYHLSNLLASIACLHSLGFSFEDLRRVLASVRGVPGRLERVGDRAVFIDYAHTPDALRSVCQSLRELVTGRLIVVFGCGGERDRGKRPMMGRVVREFADFAIVTSDNPEVRNHWILLKKSCRGSLKPRPALNGKLKAIVERRPRRRCRPQEKGTPCLSPERGMKPIRKLRGFVTHTPIGSFAKNYWGFRCSYELAKLPKPSGLSLSPSIRQGTMAVLLSILL